MFDFRRGAALFVIFAVTLVVTGAAGPALAQPPVARPQPPPQPSGTEPTTPVKAAPQPAQPAPGEAAAPTAAVKPAAAAAKSPAAATPVPVAPATPAPAAAAPAAPPSGNEPPTEAYLGVPIMPNAEYLGSYDAGGAGQRFFLFGVAHSFADVVAYYRSVLKQKGELVFEIPPTHMFEVGKFKEEQVAFPPGVTVKDYRLGGASGLANPRPGATPVAFPTVIQIVPPAVIPATRAR